MSSGWNMVGTGAALLALAEYRRTRRAFGLPLLRVTGALVLLVRDGGRRATGAPRLTPAGAAS